MYRKRENQLLLPHEFHLPFAGKLEEENRWVTLTPLISWNLVVRLIRLVHGRLRLDPPTNYTFVE
jgi:hypothetical protein